MDSFSSPIPQNKRFGRLQITPQQYRILHWIANPRASQTGLRMGGRIQTLGHLRKVNLISYDRETDRYALTDLGRETFDAIPSNFWQFPPWFLFKEAQDAT